MRPENTDYCANRRECVALEDMRQKRSIRNDVLILLHCNAVARPSGIPKMCERYCRFVQGESIVWTCDPPEDIGREELNLKSMQPKDEDCMGEYRVATSLATKERRNAKSNTNAEPRAREALPAPARHELLLHLSVRGDRWRGAGNSSSRWVDDGDGIACPLS